MRPVDGSKLEHRYAAVNGVRLHYVEAGQECDQPPVILLHGFPEFWYGWRNQIPTLAMAGHRVVVPDLRGYGDSDKPRPVKEYRVERLVDDLLALIDHLGGRARVVGHDWGGVIAWRTAMQDGGRIERLVILNAPHPAAYLRQIRRPAQLMRSWYVFFFQLPWLPEMVFRAFDFRTLRNLFRHGPARREAFTEQDIEQYVQAFRRLRAVESAINYYRAALRSGPTAIQRAIKPVHQPTLLIWGEKDRYIVPEAALGVEKWATNLRIERFKDATHWVQHDEPERVNQLLLEFLGSR